MAVTEQTPLNSYTANGATTVFVFSFLVIQATDLVVQTVDSAGVPTTKVLGVDYTVAGLGVAGGGTVTFVSAPANGLKVVIFRDSDISRATDYQDNGDLLADTVNTDFDRLWLVMQEIFNGGKGVPTSLRVPNGETVTALPNAAARASRVLAFDGSGNPLMLAGVDASSAAALALDLANNGNIAKGANQVGLLLTGANEIATLVAPFLNLTVKGAKKHFGCVGDGSANDYVKLANALQATGKLIELEEGTYLFNTALPAPSCQGIIGRGQDVSILKPGAGIAKALSIGGTNYPRLLQDFKVDGSLTTGATAIYLGDASSVAVHLMRVRVKSFSGAGAIGLRVGDVLKSLIEACTADTCNEGLRLQKTTGGFPTSTRFDTWVSTNITTYGVKVIDANQMEFLNAIFESCGNEGILADSSSGSQIIDLIFRGGWCEQNNGNNNTKYHAVFGTNSSAGTIRPKVEGMFFDTNGGGTAAKAVQFNGSEVAGYDLLGPRLASTYAGAIRRQNGAYGVTHGWLPYIDYNSCFSEDVRGLDFGPFGGMRDYAPGTSFSTNIGAYGASFSGVPTINVYRYKQDGRVLRMDWDIVLQLLAITPAWIKIPLPPGLTLNHNNVLGSLQLLDGATGKAAVCLAQSSDNTVLCRTADLSNLTSGNAITLRGSITVELA